MSFINERSLLDNMFNVVKNHVDFLTDHKRSTEFYAGITSAHKDGGKDQSAMIWGVTGATHDPLVILKPDNNKILRRQQYNNLDQSMCVRIQDTMKALYAMTPPSLVTCILDKYLSHDIVGLVTQYYGGDDTYLRAEKRVSTSIRQIYKRTFSHSKWVLIKARRSKSVGYFLWTLLRKEGVVCASDEFVIIMSQFITYHKEIGLALLLMFGKPFNVGWLRVSVDELLYIKGLHFGLEGAGLITTKCKHSKCEEMRSIIHVHDRPTIHEVTRKRKHDHDNK